MNTLRLVKIQKISTSPESQNTQDIVQPRHVAAGGIIRCEVPPAVIGAENYLHQDI